MSDSPRYVFGTEIARGGMGVVLRATDTALGREVAVKVLQDKYAPGSGAARRFVDEARITGGLQHPGIPPVHDLGSLPDGRPFLAMKLIKGDTLDDLLKARPTPAADRGRFVAAFEAVCQAVAYAHAHDIVHRDLKPANVMVGAFGEVQVLDWGLAKSLASRGREPPDSEPADPDSTAAETDIHSPRDADDPLTRDGSVLGTPAYMPPEQAIGAVDQIDQRSDVFGLGGVLAAVLTGHPPFTGDTAASTRQLAAKGKVDDCFARLAACGADPELVALCKSCLAPEKDGRPADAGEVARAVAALRAAADDRARRAELDRAAAEARAAEGRKRRRVQLVLAAAVVLLVAGAGGVAVWRVDEDGRKRAEVLRLEGEESERKARAAAAVATLLDQVRASLADGNAELAGTFLAQADRRAADDAVADHAARLAAARAALGLLRELNGVDAFRWTQVGSTSSSAELNLDSLTTGRAETTKSRFPADVRVADQWAKSFATAGLVPGRTPVAEFSTRVNASPVRATLVAALDDWLALAAAGSVRDVLAAADPDPFRDEVRRLLAARDAAGLVALADRPEWATQPPGLLRACAAAVPDELARRLLTRAAESRPNDFGTVMQLGLTYRANRMVTAADRARWFQAAVALRPLNAAGRLNLGMSLSDQGNPDGAVAAYREALRLKPDYAAAYTALGIAFEAKRDRAAAEAAYRDAIRLDPADPAPHNNLGNVLRAAGDRDGAVAAYREAVRLDPDYAPPHNGLGNALVSAREYAAAAAAYREAIRIEPTYPSPHNGLGNALSMLHDAAGAAAAYREAIRLDPTNPNPRNGLGNALKNKGDLDGAAAAYREAIRLDPTNPLPHNGLGNALYFGKNLDGAADAFRDAIRLKPDYAAPHNGLGTTLKKQGDAVGAAAAYREAIRLDPKLANAHHGLGTALADLEDWAGAVAAYRVALGLAPRDPFLHHNLGVALEARYELADAAAAFGEAVRLNPQLVGTHTELGDVSRKLGRLDAAVAAYRAALALDPQFDAARSGLGYVQRLQRGEVPTAPPPRAVTR